MVGFDDIVITGLGAVTPIGIGKTVLEQSLNSGRCNSKVLYGCETEEARMIGAPIEDYDGKDYITPRKALKMMGREVQISHTAAHLAWEDANLLDQQICSERIGVVFGSEMIPGDLNDLAPCVRSCSTGPDINHDLWGKNLAKEVFPLWMLRYLPNMPACHVAIAVDARGPNNTIVMEEISGLLAIAESMSIMQRDQADIMIVGAISSRITPTRLLYRRNAYYFNHTRSDAPKQFHSRAFDCQRSGIVPAEAAVTLILERRKHAVARGAKIYGQVLSAVSRYAKTETPSGGSTQAICNAAVEALKHADIRAHDLACVSAQGFSESKLDIVEARAIHDFAAETPVTSYSSYLGTAGAASGLVQLAAAVIAANNHQVLPTLGYSQKDQACPIHVCNQTLRTERHHLLQLGFTFEGQAAAVVIDC